MHHKTYRFRYEKRSLLWPRDIHAAECLQHLDALLEILQGYDRTVRVSNSEHAIHFPTPPTNQQGRWRDTSYRYSARFNMGGDKIHGSLHTLHGEGSLWTPELSLIVATGITTSIFLHNFGQEDIAFPLLTASVVGNIIAAYGAQRGRCKSLELTVVHLHGSRNNEFDDALQRLRDYTL